MKVIDHFPAAQNVTFLPQEVLNLIINYIRLDRSQNAAQRDLWSCCLVSRDWYTSTVKHLYEAPLISSRNFAEFARTLSPPLAARARRAGLEYLVQHLDMGSLAYESKKSTTSRLISRTKTSLRSFVAPAVSFSTTSLAPLSKCTKLQRVDLSRDVYDFSFLQLWRAIHSLTELLWLSLPKDIKSLAYLLNDPPAGKADSNNWPPNLTSLQVNDTQVAGDFRHWTAFLQTLPPSLDTIIFRNLTFYDSFDEIGQVETEAPHVTTLTIGVNRSDDTYYFNHLCRPYPNLSKIIVPAMTSWVLKNFLFTSYGSSWSLNATAHRQLLPPQNLEILVLEESPDFPSSNHIRLSALEQFAQMCPKLIRIDVPEAYLSIDEEDDDTLDKLNSILGKRAAELKGGTRGMSVTQAGVFTTEGPKNAQVGMKRSFRYRDGD